MSAGDDRWSSGDAYEAYMGRWSRRLEQRLQPKAGGPIRLRARAWAVRGSRG